MINNNNRISNFQLMILLANSIIGVGILSLPSSLARELDTDGWVILLISGVLVCIFTILITKLMNMFEGKTIVEISKNLVGSPITIIIMSIYIIYLLGLAAFVVRVFAEVIKMFLLLSTPTEIIIITMLLTTAYISRCGIEALARITLIIVPIVFIPLFVIGIVLFQELDFTNLLPLFRFTVMDVIKAIPVSFFSFAGFEFLLIYMAFVEKPKESMKYNVMAIIIVIAIYEIVFIVTLARFSVSELKGQLWPLLSLMKTVEFPGAFIENVEGIIMAIWVLLIFITLGPALYGMSVVTSKIFSLKEHKMFVLPAIPIIYILALIPDNLAEVYEFMEYFTYYIGTISVILVPTVLYFIAVARKKGRDGKNEQDA